MVKQARTMRGRALSLQERVDSTESKAREGKWFRRISLGLIVLFGVLYLHSMNRIAVQGYAIRAAEKQLASLKQENNQLRIQEAELKSLRRIEEAGQRLNMFESQEVTYIEELSPIALR
jgi:hypothetical protein